MNVRTFACQKPEGTFGKRIVC